MKTQRSLSLGAALLATLALTACGGGGSETTPVAPPIGNPPPPPVVEPTARVTLAGRVVDEPIANASVVASIGSATARTMADANGNYSLRIEVPQTSASQPVVVTATGTGAQANVVLVSLPGSVATLVTDAGADGVLASSENIRANVTHVSTAEAALVMELTGGAAPSSQEQQEGLIKRVDPVALLDLAAAIKLIVDTSEYNLPEGVVSTLAFAQNAGVRSEYIEEIKEKAPEDLEAAKQDTVNSSEAVQQTRASDIPARLYAAIVDNDARYSVNIFNQVRAYTFAADGSGTRYSAAGYSTTRWQLSGNQIVVNLDVPESSEGFPLVDTNGDGTPDRSVRRISTIAQEELTLLSESLVAVSATVQETHPNKEIPDRTITDTASQTIILPATDFEPFLPTGFASGGGKLLTSTYLAQTAIGANQFSGDIFNFTAGGNGSAQVTGRSFGWAVSDAGTLTMNLPDNVSVSYHGLDIDYSNQDPQTSYVFAEITTPGARYVDVVKVIQPAMPLVFDTAAIPGEYFLYGLGNFESGRDLYDGRLMGFSLQFYDDRTGFQSSDGLTGDGTVARETLETHPFGFFRWKLGSNGALVVERQFDSNASSNRASRTCDPATNTNCKVNDRRELIPFAVSGSRYYWLERRQISSGGEVSGSTPSTFIQRYWDMGSQSKAIVGSWEVLIPAARGGNDVKLVASFFGNGQYVLGGVSNDPECKSDNGGGGNADIEAKGNGWEKGDYSWNPATGLISISNVTETDGSCGLSEGPGADFDDLEYLTFNQDGTLKVRGQSTPQQNPVDEGTVLRRIASVKSRLTGGWKGINESNAAANSAVPDPLATIYYFPDNTYLLLEAQFDSEAQDECANGGIELGTFSFDAANGRFTVTGVQAETNGPECGLFNGGEPSTYVFQTDSRIDISSGSEPDDVYAIGKITAP